MDSKLGERTVIIGPIKVPSRVDNSRASQVSLFRWPFQPWRVPNPIWVVPLYSYCGWVIIWHSALRYYLCDLLYH